MLPLTTILFFLVLGIFFALFIKKLNFQIGMRGKDINKSSEPEITESGGLAPLLTMLVFTLLNPAYLSIFAIPAVFGILGFLDDTKNKFKTKPFSWRIRALIIALISLSYAYILTYDPLLTIIFSLYIAGLASLVNTFAGLNGWEVGSSFFILLFLIYLLQAHSYFFLLPYAIILEIAIFALILFNLYPAKIFPGDSGTLFIGASIASISLATFDLLIILTTFLFFIPHIIDFFFLKLLTNTKDMSQKRMRPYTLKNNKLHIPDYKGKIKYDFAKLLIKLLGPLKEYQIVLLLWFIVILNCTLWIAIL